MALYKFVGCGNSNRIFNLSLVQAQHTKRGEIKLNSGFVSLARILELRKWNRLSGCLWLGLNGGRNNVQLWACRWRTMTCQQARLQNTTTAASDHPPPFSLSPLTLRGDVSSSQRPLRHSLDTCYFQEEENSQVCSSLWFQPLFIFTLSSPRGLCSVGGLVADIPYSSTQETWLISSRSITESSLEDTSRQCVSVAAELLGAPWAKWSVG